MPKIVDHQQRRQEIATAAADVLARDGLAGFTTRHIALEAGVSKGILDHYFADKAELFITVLSLYYDRIGIRVRRAAKGKKGLDALRAAMLETLPIDMARRSEAIAEISFATQSVSDLALRRWYRTERTRFRTRLCEYVEAVEIDDGVSLDVSAEHAADMLLALMDSVSLQAVIGDDLSGTDQQAALDRTLALIFTA